MPFRTPFAQKVMQWMTVTLGTLSAAIIGYAVLFPGESSEGIAPAGLIAPRSGVEGRLLPDHTQHRAEWETITAERILSGTTIPANKNVVIQIPQEVTRITRQVLFGRHGKDIRYWGYCFPPDPNVAYARTSRGFPGELFLSEKEREIRREKLLRDRRRTFSIFKNLTETDLNETQTPIKSLIRHQLEIFTGGTSCYVMTEKSLPIGVDFDNDELNSALERAFGSSPDRSDSDGDGVIDGLEVFRLGTHPTKRDSDGDGIIDGIEDANRNGKVDITETNPMLWDTDSDGLCDGLCKVNKGLDIRGEDKNINGKVDTGEYDPRKKDTDNDGIFDEHEVYLCVLGGGTDC